MLIFIAGLMWCAVGIMLLHYSVTWLIQAGVSQGIIFLIAGLTVAYPVYRYGFLRLALKNLNRLAALDEPRCLFSFITWKSYLIVPVMVAMGIGLRHSALPRTYLSVIYNGIGLGLFSSGITYIRSLFTSKKRRQAD